MELTSPHTCPLFITRLFTVNRFYMPCIGSSDRAAALCLPFRSHKNPQFREDDSLLGADGEYVVSASDDGRVRIFNYPCVVEDAPHRWGVGWACTKTCACKPVSCIAKDGPHRWRAKLGM
jgi:hypothetical protein